MIHHWRGRLTTKASAFPAVNWREAGISF